MKKSNLNRNFKICCIGVMTISLIVLAFETFTKQEANMIKTVLDKLVKKWGVSKTTKIICLIMFGASTGGFIGVSVFPDEPEMSIEEKGDEK